MPAAVAIPAIIGAASTGASLVGAKMASNTAKNAAKIQTDATAKAQDFNQRAYDDQKAALAPYLDFGKQSLASLQQHYGGQPLVNRFAPTGMTDQGRTSYAQPQQLAPNASGMTLADMQQHGQQGPPQMPMPQGGGQMVTLRAPTGQMAQFPMGSPEIQRAMQAGAQRVA